MALVDISGSAVEVVLLAGEEQNKIRYGPLFLVGNSLMYILNKINT